MLQVVIRAVAVAKWIQQKSQSQEERNKIKCEVRGEWKLKRKKKPINTCIQNICSTVIPPDICAVEMFYLICCNH